MTEKDLDQLHNIISLGYSEHPRLSEYQRLVYPVVSRRSGGLSLGINLNPDKKCSFNCVYCQVDRAKKITGLKVEVRQVVTELKYWLDVFAKNEGKYKGFLLKDISIAGDGEPTTAKQLPQILLKLIGLKKEYKLADCRIILFTNASRINRRDLMPVFDDLMANQGEIWCKFDFWDEQSLKMINRSKISAKKLLENIRAVGRMYPLTLQSCFFSWQSEVYSNQKYQQYVEKVNRLISDEVKIRLIQAYTLARRPADDRATAWSDIEMNQLTSFLGQQISVPIETFYTTGTK